MGVYGGLRTIFWGILCVLEVFVSIVVHASYALSILFSAIWIDIKTGSSSGPQHSAKVTPLIEAAEQDTDYKGVSNFVVADTANESLSAAGAFFEAHEKVPIVLVHGLFGFGKGVRTCSIHSVPYKFLCVRVRPRFFTVLCCSYILFVDLCFLGQWSCELV